MTKKWEQPLIKNLGVEFTKNEIEDFNLNTRGELYCACCNKYFGNQFKDSDAVKNLTAHRLDVHGTEPGQPCPIS